LFELKVRNFQEATYITAASEDLDFLDENGKQLTFDTI
jgi:hypothetical protein